MKLTDFRQIIQQQLHSLSDACEKQLRYVQRYPYSEVVEEIECQIHDAYYDMLLFAYPHGERVTADYTIDHTIEVIEIHDFLPDELEELTEEQFQAQNEEVVSWLRERWLNAGGSSFPLMFSITFHDEE